MQRSDSTYSRALSSSVPQSPNERLLFEMVIKQVRNWLWCLMKHHDVEPYGGLWLHEGWAFWQIKSYQEPNRESLADSR